MEEENKLKKELRKSDVTEIKDKMKQALNEGLIENLLSNNEVEFEYNETTYKVCKLIYKARQELHRKRAEKHLELLQDDKYVPEDKIIELYKNKGVDIKELDRQFSTFQQQIDRLKLKLGESIQNKLPEKELQILRDKIVDLQNKQGDVSIKKTNYLSNSLESQLNIWAYEYLVYLMSEKLVKGKDLGDGNKEANKWERIANSFEEFCDLEEDLINLLAVRTSLISNPNTYLS